MESSVLICVIEYGCLMTWFNSANFCSTCCFKAIKLCMVAAPNGSAALMTMMMMMIEKIGKLVAYVDTLKVQ